MLAGRRVRKLKIKPFRDKVGFDQLSSHGKTLKTQILMLLVNCYGDIVWSLYASAESLRAASF
jgi:hypothetical protein